MQVNDTDRLIVFGDKKLGYAFAVHEVYRFSGQNIRTNGLGAAGHQFAGGFGEHIGRQAAAQVTVGDDAFQISLLVNNADAAEHFGGHHQQSFLHGSVFVNQRNFIAFVQKVSDLMQERAQFSARMALAKIGFGEAFAFQQADGKNVSQHQSCRGGGGRCQAQRTGFAVIRKLQQDITGAPQSTVGIFGDGNQGNAVTFAVNDDVGKFFGFAGI